MKYKKSYDICRLCNVVIGPFILALSVVSGGDLELLFELPGEGRIVPKATLEAYISDGSGSGIQKLLGPKKSFTGDVLVDTVAGF